MALIHADFPSGSQGLYGTSRAAMLDGIWAEVNSFNSISPDPDPSIGASGRVLEHGASNGDIARIVLPSAQTKVGMGARQWLDSIPSSDQGRPAFAEWRTTGNGTIGYCYFTTTGAIAFVNGSSGAPLFTTPNPVVTANAWWHVEACLTCGTSSDAVIEVRVNGIPVINETGFSTSSANVGQVSSNTYLGGLNAVPVRFVKDFILWDGSGSVNNNFLGTVSVFWNPVDSDISLGGWLTNRTGTTGTNLIDGITPSNIFTASGRLDVDGTEYIRIDNTYYRPTAGSVDAGTPAGTISNPWLVAQGTDIASDLANLFAAINASGTPGTTYSTALTAHPTVEANGLDSTRILVQSIDKATTGYTFTDTMANASFASETMSRLQPQDLSFISADDTPPAAAEFTLSNLPADVTSVRGIIPFVRAAKIDGGDGNIQVSLSPDGVNYDIGPDTPITTAFTFWPNNSAPFVSEINPATSAPWTPIEFNGARIRIDRTI